MCVCIAIKLYFKYSLVVVFIKYMYTLAQKKENIKFHQYLHNMYNQRGKFENFIQYRKNKFPIKRVLLNEFLFP